MGIGEQNGDDREIVMNVIDEGKKRDTDNDVERQRKTIDH